MVGVVQWCLCMHDLSLHSLFYFPVVEVVGIAVVVSISIVVVVATVAIVVSINIVVLSPLDYHGIRL